MPRSESPAAEPAPSRAATFACAAAIAAAAAAAYANSFRNGFVFDDIESIPRNPTLRTLWGALRPPFGGMTVGGRPLLNFSFAINYAIGGLSVGSYHALNLIIHIGAALALFGILRRTLVRLGRASEPAVLIAFSVALLWAVHPLQTEAVAYIVQRAESLMGLFYLLALYCFIRGARLCPLDAGSAAAVSDFADREGRKPEVGPNLWCGLSWLACLLGTLTKETMATAPVVILLYDRTFAAGSFREAWTRRKRYYLALGATWIPLVILVAGSGGNRGGSMGFGAGERWAASLATQPIAVLSYLRLALWPRPLIFDHGPTQAPPCGLALAAALAVGALLAAALVGLRRNSAAGFLGAAFFLILAPPSLMPDAIQWMVEHRMYLPLAAVLAGAAALAERFFVFDRRILWFVLPLAALLAGLTARRSRDYRSELALWADTAAKLPESGRAQANLGGFLLAAGKAEEAREALAAAVRLAPEDSLAHNDLGSALLALGRPEAAAAEYAAAARLAPNDAEVRANLENARTQAAVAHFNRGNRRALSGDFAAAAAEYEAALRFDPGLERARANLAAVLAAELSH